MRSGHNSGIPKVPGNVNRIRKFPSKAESAQSSSEYWPTDLKSEVSVAVPRKDEEYSDSAWADNRTDMRSI